MAQLGFFDLSDRYASLDAKKDPLVEIDAVVPWEEFRPALERGCGFAHAVQLPYWIHKMNPSRDLCNRALLTDKGSQAKAPMMASHRSEMAHQTEALYQMKAFPPYLSDCLKTIQVLVNGVL